MDWQPIREAKPDGTVCQLRFRDPLGSYEMDGGCFLHDDGEWYKIEPPTQIRAKPTHFRPLPHKEPER